MIGQSLALMRRALQTDARSARTFLFQAALAAVILWGLAILHTEIHYVSAPGLQLFRIIAYLNYTFVTFAGATFLATVITEEKEERTLGLLKMAGVGPLAVLLGKWTPRALGAALLILVQIPFTALAVTLGGVLWNQVLAAYVVLLAHLFLVANLGLLASVLASRTSVACGIVVAALLGFHVLPWFLSALSYRIGVLPTFLLDMVETLFAMSGLNRMPVILASGFAEPIFGQQVWANVAAGGLLFLTAWLLFEPCTRNDVEPGGPLLWTRVWMRLRGRRQRRVWSAPLVWKDFHGVGGGPPALVFKFLAYSLVILGPASMDEWNPYWREVLGGYCLSIGLFAICLEIPYLTTRVFRNELSERTWSTLVLLPRTIPEIAYPKLAGAALSLLPVGFWVVLGLGLLLDAIVDSLRRHDTLLFLSYFGLQLLLAMHLATYLSVRQKWAVWPVAMFLGAFLVLMINVLYMSCLASTGPAEGPLVLACILTVPAVFWLHAMIGHSLFAQAGE